MTAAERLDTVGKLLNEFNEPLTVLPWWRDFFAALDDPNIHELLLSVVRQTGKSTLCGAAAVTELLGVPSSYTLLIAASKDQQSAVFERKVRQPLERRISPESRKQLGLKFTAHGVRCERIGSALEVVASNEATATGRTPSLLIIDEARDVDDVVYLALAPSVLGANGKLVIASSAGRPSGFFYELLQTPSEHTWVYRSAINDNPRAKAGLVDFIRTRLALVSPAAAQRELANEFASDGESLIAPSLIDAAIESRLGELPTSRLPAYAFLDLSRKRDLTTRVVVVRDAARRPEATDHLVLASIRIWNPRECPGGETPFDEVRADMASLTARFPNLEKILVDEGAEAGAVLPYARSDSRLALLVDGFTASVQTNMELWGALTARLHGQTLSIPRDERLLAELRSLRREEFAFGAKWRVMDSSRRLHRDVSVSLAGACMAAGIDDGVPFTLVGSPTYQAWEARQVARAPLPDPLPDDEPDDDDDIADDAPVTPWAHLPAPFAFLRDKARRQMDRFTAKRTAPKPPSVNSDDVDQKIRARLAREDAAAQAEQDERAQQGRDWLEEQLKQGGGYWAPNSWWH